MGLVESCVYSVGISLEKVFLRVLSHSMPKES